MKKIRIVILNKSRNQLCIEYKQCGLAGITEMRINRRAVIKLLEGRYELSMGYENANLVMNAGINGVRDIEETPSIVNDKCKGIRLLIHGPVNTVKLKCKEKISVAGLIEKLS